jgi:hypothetical protein
MSRACLQSPILECNGDELQLRNNFSVFFLNGNQFQSQDKLGLNKLFDKFDGSSKEKAQAPVAEQPSEPSTPVGKKCFDIRSRESGVFVTALHRRRQIDNDSSPKSDQRGSKCFQGI